MTDQKEFNNQHQTLHGLSSKGDYYRIIDSESTRLNINKFNTKSKDEDNDK